MTTKFTKWLYNVPFGCKKDKMDIKKYQHLPLQDLPKFAQIGIFALEIYHLAAPVLAFCNF
jgi:hypothetical protein